ncbi:MAG: hypothetical protein AAF743_12255, partial [Planctomycetota bacterium]
MRPTHTTPRGVVIARGLAALLAVSFTAAAAGEWRHNTFPGPRHAEQTERFAPGEGSDRAEWISGFGVSPLLADGHDTPLMLQVTDLGPLVVNTDGKHFVPADLPIAGGHAVAFSPHNGSRAYAFMRHDPVLGIDHGWWRTDDRGTTWQFMIEAPEIRGQMRNLLHDPHPDRADHIYLTAAGRGIMRSTDDGASFETIDLGGWVHTLAAVADGETTHLFATFDPHDGRDPNRGPTHVNKFSGKLMHFTIDADGSMSEGRVLHESVVDVETHADHPDQVWLLAPTNAGEAQVLRATLTDDGLTDSTVLYQGFHRRGGTVRVNPANADHLYTTTFGPVALHPLQVSRDGGATWQSFAIESIDGNDYVTGIRDYGPFNHRSPDGSISADGHNKVDGDRDLIGFLPGDPDALVGYFSNMPKPPLRSDDGGLSWVPFATGGTFKPADQIAVSADGQTIALAMSEYGVLVTQDAGLSWRGYHHINAPTMEAAYAAHASQPNPWKSKTGWGVALDPRDPRVMVATYGWGPTHVLRSEDAGESWESVATFEPRLASDPTKPYHDATGVFWHRQNPDVVYAGSLISTDAGRTFTPIPGGKFVTSMANHDGDLLICREFAARIWASSDAGQTWTSIPSPPRRDDKALTVNYNLAAITIDPRPEHNPKHGGGWRLLVGG